MPLSFSLVSLFFLHHAKVQKFILKSPKLITNYKKHRSRRKFIKERIRKIRNKCVNLHPIMRSSKESAILKMNKRYGLKHRLMRQYRRHNHYDTGWTCQYGENELDGYSFSLCSNQALNKELRTQNNRKQKQLAAPSPLIVSPQPPADAMFSVIHSPVCKLFIYGPPSAFCRHEAWLLLCLEDVFRTIKIDAGKQSPPFIRQ